MEKEKLLNYIAPCSLLCSTCMAYKGGPVTECAKRLQVYCEGMCEFLSQNQSEEDRKNTRAFFDNFNAALWNLSGGSCHGCRSDSDQKGGCLSGCVVPECVKEHGIDFCAECNEFPCQKAKEFFGSVGGSLDKVWEVGSRRIREVGIETYYDEKKDVSHYLHYKKNKTE